MRIVSGNRMNNLAGRSKDYGYVLRDFFFGVVSVTKAITVLATYYS